MRNDDDATLLQAWTGRQDQRAFRQLVERYAGLVYSAAKRRSGCEQVAAEAAQDVFVRLARRAGSIRRSESLPSWLYTAAVHAAADQYRKEARHRERLRRLEESGPVSAPEVNEEPAWKDALPVLDEAICHLNATDRGILLARYCQGETLTDAARRFGLSVAAAQKRGERALEKLAGMLKRRGVAVSVIALASALSAPRSQAVPAGLTGKWCAAALNAGQSGAVSGWLGFLHAKGLATAAALSAACIPVGKQLSANAGVTSAASSETPPAGSPSLSANAGSPVLARPLPNGLDLDVLAREIRSFPPPQGRLQKELELRAVMLTLDSAQCAAVSQILAEAPSAPLLLDVTDDLFTRWESVDRHAALTAAKELPAAPVGNYARNAVLTAWSQKDAAGMLEHFSPDLGREEAGILPATACGQALMAWARSQPREAMRAALVLPVLPPKYGPGMVDFVLRGWADYDQDAAQQWLATEAPPGERTVRYKRFISYLGNERPERAWHSLLRWPDRVQAQAEAQSTLKMWAVNQPGPAATAWLEGPEEWKNADYALVLGETVGASDPSLAPRIAAQISDPSVRRAFSDAAEKRAQRAENQE